MYEGRCSGQTRLMLRVVATKTQPQHILSLQEHQPQSEHGGGSIIPCLLQVIIVVSYITVFLEV